MEFKTNTNMLLILILCVINIDGITGQEKTHYIGAVVDYAAKFDEGLTPSKRLVQNANEYLRFIKDASAQNADIIVFPECGLTSIHLPSSLDKLFPFATVIPDPLLGTYNPCNDTQHPLKNQKWPTFLMNISCAAQENKIYVVLNLPERKVNNSSNVEDTDLIYNTNIVFDRYGNLIARYRKFNLFGEPGFSITKAPELIKFKTDFGVTFGTFICFDILFKEPALELLAKNEDVTDIVYPTAWFSELPFLTAIQTQAGWAKANGVNFLSAGYNNPAKESGGSGIFPVDGSIKYIMPSKHESTMVIHQVPIIKKRKVSVVAQQKAISVAPTLVGMETKAEHLSKYTSVLINETITDYRLCHNEFCCVFDIGFNKLNVVDYYYRMIVFEGVRNFGIVPYDIQVCGVAACTDKTIDSCGKRINSPTNPSIVFDPISIKGDMFNKNSTFIPSYTDYYLGTAYNYFYNTSIVQDKQLQIEMKTLEPVKNLLGFGIYGTYCNSSSSGVFTSNFYLLIVAFFIVKFIYE